MQVKVPAYAVFCTKNYLFFKHSAEKYFQMAKIKSNSLTKIDFGCKIIA